MMMPWTPPKTLSRRPVAVIVAGVLGRRIGKRWNQAVGPKFDLLILFARLRMGFGRI